MSYKIKNRFSGEVIFTATGDTLRDAVLEAWKSGAYLSRADMSRAYLSRANLSGADLSGADLSGANLIGANLIGANLSRADMSRANLIGADMSGADMSRADMSGADMSRAYLSGAKIDAYTLARRVAQVRRDDGYEFFGFALECGGLLIRAGCQTRLIADYRQHVADDYPNTPKAVETLAILDFIEARAKA